MSEELDHKLFKALKENCANLYHRPTQFDIQTLKKSLQTSVFELSHSINNLQRQGLIRIHMGIPGELNKVELLRQ